MKARAAAIPVLVVINKADLGEPTPDYLALLDVKRLTWIQGNSTGNPAARESYRQAFKDGIRGLLPRLFTAPPSLLGDLLPAGGMAVLVVPNRLGSAARPAHCPASAKPARSLG